MSDIGQRMTLADLAAEPSPTTSTFAVELSKLHAEQFTGRVVIHFGQGVPSSLEIVTSRFVRLAQPDRRAYTAR